MKHFNVINQYNFEQKTLFGEQKRKFQDKNPIFWDKVDNSRFSKLNMVYVRTRITLFYNYK